MFREKISIPSINQIFVHSFDWFLWTVGYSLLFILVLACTAWSNSEFLICIGLAAYMGIGFGIGKLRRITTKSHLLMMMGLPPLQAAVTIANRKSRSVQ